MTCSMCISRRLRSTLFGIVLLSAVPCLGQDLYVDASATGGNNGSSWAQAFTDLQSALDVEAEPPSATQVIHVAEGVYHPTAYPPSGSTSSPANKTFFIDKPVTMLGGYPSGGGDRDWLTHSTILSGDLDGDDTGKVGGIVQGTGGFVGTNACTVVTIDGVRDGLLLDGVIINAGNGNQAGCSSGGGGVRLTNDDFATLGQTGTILADCALIANAAFNYGGGLYSENLYSLGSPTPAIDNCVFNNNVAGDSGGGLYAKGNLGTMILTNVTFSANAAQSGGHSSQAGGAIAFEDLTTSGPYEIRIEDSSFNSNSSSTRPSVLYLRATLDGSTSDPTYTTVEIDGSMIESSGDFFQVDAGPNGATVVPAIHLASTTLQGVSVCPPYVATCDPTTCQKLGCPENCTCPAADAVGDIDPVEAARSKAIGEARRFGPQKPNPFRRDHRP